MSALSKGPQAGRIVSDTVIIAAAVNADDRREMLGTAFGRTEPEPVRTANLRLRGPLARHLNGSSTIMGCTLACVVASISWNSLKWTPLPSLRSDGVPRPSQ